MPGSVRTRATTVLALTAVLSSAGCGLAIPNDPDGTLRDVTGGTLRVGVDTNSGVEPLIEVVEGFADQLDAEIEWHEHGEEHLVAMLEGDDIDLAVGGFTDQTPWSSRAGMTRPIVGIPALDDPTVLLVQLGENAFLTELEAYLDAEDLT